jgi:hypothetical protein
MNTTGSKPKIAKRPTVLLAPPEGRSDGAKCGLRRTLGTTLIVLCLIALINPWPPQRTFAFAKLQNRFDRLSDGSVSATATHLVGFTYTDTTDPVGSVEIEFCSNDPFPGLPCTAPSGFDLTAATLASQTGETGFVIHPSSTANKIILTRAPSAPGAVAATYQFDNVVNPDSSGTYYIRLRTFASLDGTGVENEKGGVAFAITEVFNVTTEVPPYLIFCAAITISSLDCSTATSFFMDMGDFRTTATSSGTSQMMAATNAAFGYTISISGTTLTSGNNVIPALSTQTASSTGTSQFGINLRANTNPAVGSNPSGPGSATVTANYNSPNLFRFVSGDAVASASGTNSERLFTISYITNISAAQSPGIYATTVSYICLANF